MNKIINPINNKKFSIFKSSGKKLLKKYVKQFLYGGTSEEEVAESEEEAPVEESEEASEEASEEETV